MKSRLCVILLVVLSISFCQQDPESAEATQTHIEEAVSGLIEASGGEVGLAFKDLETEETLFINEREMMHAASTMKVPVMIEVFRQAEDGQFSLDDRLPVKNSFRSIVDGSPYALSAESDSDVDIYGFIGSEMSIRELVRRMIVVSSNLATNIVIDLVGAKSVMASLQELGIRRMRVLRGVEDIKAYEQGLNNETDAFDMLLVLESIALGSGASEAACREMIQILSQQEFREKIPAGLPAEVPVANKTGSITAIDHDAAIIFPAGRKPYILVVLTRGILDHQKAQDLIAGLSRLIYNHVTRQPR